MDICFVGTGYVGLVTGTCLAEAGNTVWCVDKDKEKISRLQSGDLPIYEDGLQSLLLKNVNQGRLYFTTDLGTGIARAVVCFITVGTPAGINGSADLSGENLFDGRNLLNPDIVATQGFEYYCIGRNHHGK